MPFGAEIKKFEDLVRMEPIWFEQEFMLRIVHLQAVQKAFERKSHRINECRLKPVLLPHK